MSKTRCADRLFEKVEGRYLNPTDRVSRQHAEYVRTDNASGWRGRVLFLL